ncbi:3'(2'),5'-bisphosphate nucleotidase CysQ [Thiolapillus brandeum]|uniref:3'(2'),5'-bisphosphate nucleotidase CysQ n=1 Tax=Thiolapillus brandeum TaxID=1076588 RepID=A0A7U6GGG7_9GAMM|nr:3'(2'),5'-bisphosphate nucleotidase CysQ [Thiolapillus brandeum]BAO43189.1 3(2)5 -bisphosphate nucleotidase [Thiolapillus brandeum]
MTLPDIQLINHISRDAGKAILEIYEQDFAVQHKDDDSPLTQADLASHKHITAELQKLTPQIPVLSEESTHIPWEERRQWQRYWLIDPLDGTREFVKRNGEFTVNIALIQDGLPVLGVVHVPVTGITYYGDTENGAFRQDNDATPVPIHVTTPCAQPMRVAGSRSHAGDSLRQFLGRLPEHTMVSMGSSLKLCLVAEGKADIYPRLGPTSEWDTAAAQAVVEAAGGQVTDTRMQRLGYNQKESLLNPYFLVFGDSSIDWKAWL